MVARRSWLTLPLPLLMLSLSAAQAQESSSARALVAQPVRPMVAMPSSDPLLESDPETRAWGHLYLNKSGLELRQPVRVGDRQLELGVKGPLMKRERLGLAFELRF